MTPRWDEALERLLALQRLDAEIERLTRELDRAPADLAGRQEAMAAIDERIAQVEQRTKVLRAQVLLRENEVKTHERKLARLKDQAGSVRTNKEFVAFRSEIANEQREADRLQNEVLKILDVVEQADARVEEFRRERQREQDLAAKMRAEIHDRHADLRAKRDGLVVSRPAALQGIPPEWLELYERVHAVRGQGMAPLEGSYCGACGDVQTRNDVYAAQNRTRPVLCNGCNRLIYQP